MFYRESEDCLRVAILFLWILYIYSLVYNSSDPNCPSHSFSMFKEPQLQK